MKKKLTAVLCVLLVIMISCCVFATTITAAGASLSYNFTNNQKGFAQGTITLSGGSGSYSLYWADDTKALDGFDPIATVSGSGSYTMPAYTAIPAKATKVIAVNGTNLSVSSAAAVYQIPDNKKLGKTDSDLLYSFASYSDIHMESNSVTPYDGWSAKYPYDNQHLTAAFNTAAARGVDFIVTTGDHVNNQRNDNNNGNNNTYAEEWNTYLKILAASNYVNPVYEAIGNHELWNYETDTNKRPRDWTYGSYYFSAVTGLDSTAATLNSGKAYYEITEPTTGDHFLFMALEGGFYTDANDEFSDAQLSWLESKLNAYKNDGKNTFILEHANFDKWGSGDQLDNPIYDIPLKFSNSATTKLKNILCAHPEAVIITGHTHFKYSLQLNYSDNNKTSATMIHNSSIGGVRDIQNRTTRINDKSLANSEGYIVEVYDDCTIFYGTNVMSNKTYPWATYIVAQNTSALNNPTEPETQPATQKPTEKPTQPPTEKPTYGPLPTNPLKPTEPETQPQTQPETQKPTEAEILWGDVDNDLSVTILDATAIQRHLADLDTLDAAAIKRGQVCGDALSILDATMIQRKLADLITKFPVEELAAAGEEIEIAAVAANVELEEAGDDLSTLRTQSKAALDKYWMLASYDQYQALKKAYTQNASYEVLNAAYQNFNTAVTQFYAGDNITIRFKAPSGWSNVKAYVYNNGNDKLSAWPGNACTKSGDYWSVTVPNGKYTYIIFNSGSNQTYDLALGIVKGQGYSTFGSGSKVNGLSYKY